MVLNVVDRFTEEEERTVKHFEKYFGENIYKYLIVLFTRKDELKANDTTLSDYIDNCPSNLKKFIQKCGNRVSAFDNNLKGSEQEEQVWELLEVILKNIRENGGKFYTNDTYVTVEKRIRSVENERLKVIEKEGEILYQRETNQIHIRPEQNTKEGAPKEDAFRKDQDDFTGFELKSEQGVQKLKSRFEGISKYQTQRLKGDDEDQLNRKAKSFTQKPMHDVKGLKSHFEKLYRREEETGGIGIKEQKIKEDDNENEIRKRNETHLNENTLQDHLIKQRDPRLDNIHDISKHKRESLLKCHFPGNQGEEIKRELEKKIRLKSETIRDEIRKDIEEKHESKSFSECTIL